MTGDVTRDRHRPRRAWRAVPGLALVVLIASVIVTPGIAWAHGGEEEAAAETPARTLVQQGLALLTQQENVAEAREKLELALESKDTEAVDLAAVREALTALERDDHQTAIEHLNDALTPGEAPQAAPPEQPRAAEQEAAHEEEGGTAAEEATPPEALEHARAFEPDRDAAEWIALIVGIALGVGALGLLARQRRTASG